MRIFWTLLVWIPRDITNFFLEPGFNPRDTCRDGGILNAPRNLYERWSVLQDMSWATAMTGYQRRDRRASFHEAVAYRRQSDESCLGHWVNLSRNGGCLKLGRYLRPGTPLMLIWKNDEELKARVVWSRPPGSSGHTVVGVRFLEDSAQAADTVNSLLERAVQI